MGRPRRQSTRHPRSRVTTTSASPHSIEPTESVGPAESTESGRNETRVKGQERVGRARNSQRSTNAYVRTKSQKRKRSVSPSDSYSDSSMVRDEGRNEGGIGRGLEAAHVRMRPPTPPGVPLDLHHRHPFDGMVPDEYFDDIEWSDEDEEGWDHHMAVPELFTHPRPTKFRPPGGKARVGRSILFHRSTRYPSHDPNQPTQKLITFANVVTVTYRKCDLSRTYRRVKRYGRVGLYDHSKRPRTA